MSENNPQKPEGQVTRRECIGQGLKLGTAVALSGSLLTAGAAEKVRAAPSRAGAKHSVLFWSQPYGDPKAFNSFIDETVSAFKKKTGISVKWEQIPWTSALQKWNLALSNGDVPDVGDMFYLPTRVLQGRGKWGPLDLTKEAKAGAFGKWQNFVPVARREAIYKGRVYGIPWRIDIRGFVYDSNLWPTPPKTITEFAKQGGTVVTSKNLLSAAQTIGMPYQQLKAIGAVWGIEFLTKDLQHSAFTDKRWVAACTWTQSMIKKRVLLAQAGTDLTLPPYDNYLRGRVAALFGGNDGVIASATGTAPQMLNQTHSALAPQGAAHKHYGIASTAQFSIFENTKAKTEAIAWVRYLTSPSVAQKLSAVTGTDPSNTIVQGKMVTPFTKALYQQSRTAFSIDQPTPAWAECAATPSGPFTKLTIDIFSGADVHTALSNADKTVKAILAKYK